MRLSVTTTTERQRKSHKPQKGLAMRKYYNYYPRNFGNEYTTIYTETPEEEQQLLSWFDRNGREGSSLDRVTTKALKEMASNEKHARKTDPSFAGYCNPDAPISCNEFASRFIEGVQL